MPKQHGVPNQNFKIWHKEICNTTDDCTNMTSLRAPQYYRWAKDKPVTTNQTYGYYMQKEGFTQSVEMLPRREKHPNNYIRPFSNSAFYPPINYPCMVADATKPLPVLHPSRGYCPPSSKKFVDRDSEIYKYGECSIADRAAQIKKESRGPAGLMWNRSISAPPAFKEPTRKLKDIYMWHALAGSLVHVKNPK